MLGVIALAGRPQPLRIPQPSLVPAPRRRVIGAGLEVANALYQTVLIRVSKHHESDLRYVRALFKGGKGLQRPPGVGHPIWRHTGSKSTTTHGPYVLQDKKFQNLSSTWGARAEHLGPVPI